MDQIKVIGQDRELVNQVLTDFGKHRQDQLDQMEQELKRANSELEQLQSEMRRLTTASPNSPEELEQTTKYMTHISTEMEKAQRHCKQRWEQHLALKHAGLNEEEAQEALSSFSPIWEYNSEEGRRELMQLLIEKITYDGEELQMTFMTTGIEALSKQMEDLGGVA